MKRGGSTAVSTGFRDAVEQRRQAGAASGRPPRRRAFRALRDEPHHDVDIRAIRAVGSLFDAAFTLPRARDLRASPGLITIRRGRRRCLEDAKIPPEQFRKLL
jgi:hypothetical protein